MRVFFWLLLTLPLAAQTHRYVGEAIYYGEYLHWTGDQATRLLIVTLAITPLRLTFRRSRILNRLLQRRRDLGLITFVYTLAHVVAYLVYKESLQRTLAELPEPGMVTGWIASLLLLALALTSNNASVRRLGRRWKQLHRTVYLAAALTFAHWVLTAFDPTQAYLHLGVLVALLVLQAWQHRRTDRA